MIDEEVGATSSPPMRLMRMRGLTPRYLGSTGGETGRIKHIYLTTVCNIIAASTTEVARNAIAIMGVGATKRAHKRTQEINH